MTVRCAACGRRQPEAAEFCSECGAFLRWDDRQPEAEGENAPPPAGPAARAEPLTTFQPARSRGSGSWAPLEPEDLPEDEPAAEVDNPAPVAEPPEPAERPERREYPEYPGPGRGRGGSCTSDGWLGCASLPYTAHDPGRDSGLSWPVSTARPRAGFRHRGSHLVCPDFIFVKTTLLSALLGEVDPRERILCVEDAEELRPAHPHVVRLVARPANVEGAGQVLLRDLVRQALRMRPDRLVVGEVRGAEVCELLAALNTGHDGGAGTVHANAPREVPARLEALAALGGLAPAALHSQLAAAVQVVLHVRRDRAGARTLDALGVLRRRDGAGEVVVVPAWTRAEGWALGRADLAAMLRERGVEPPWTDPPAPPPAPPPAVPVPPDPAVRLAAAGVSGLRRESA